MKASLTGRVKKHDEWTNRYKKVDEHNNRKLFSKVGFVSISYLNIFNGIAHCLLGQVERHNMIKNASAGKSYRFLMEPHNHHTGLFFESTTLLVSEKKKKNQAKI